MAADGFEEDVLGLVEDVAEEDAAAAAAAAAEAVGLGDGFLVS